MNNTAITLTQQELWNGIAVPPISGNCCGHYQMLAWRIQTPGGCQYGSGSTEAEAWMAAARWLYIHTMNPDVRAQLRAEGVR